ncbi:hypothetical protein RQP46_002205 [Phenoliferia psychrophenolica]
MATIDSLQDGIERLILDPAPPAGEAATTFDSPAPDVDQLATVQFAIANLHISLPDEIMIKIFAELEPETIEEDPSAWSERNKSLAFLARVSQQYKRAAYDHLYGRILVFWRFTIGEPLLRAFRENPSLHPLVRTVAAVNFTDLDWTLQWAQSQGAEDKRLEMQARWPPETWDGGLPPQESQIWLLEACIATQREDPDYPWLEETSGAAQGSKEFWKWISKHTKLRTIFARDFSNTLPSTKRLAKVLGSIRELEVSGPVPAGLFPQLRSATALTLKYTPADQPPFFGIGPDDRALGLETLALKGFDMGFAALDLFRTRRHPLPHLVHLELMEVSEDFLRELGPLLLHLKSLLDLTVLMGRPSGAVDIIDSFWSLLPRTHLWRFFCNIWPADDFIAYYPKMVHNVSFMPVYQDGQDPDAPPAPFDVGPFERALNWKSTLPHLHHLVVAIPNLEDDLDTREKLGGIAKKADGFMFDMMESVFKGPSLWEAL